HTAATVFKTCECSHLCHDALGHVAANHQQLIDAVAVEISLAHDSAHEVRVKIGDELRAREDSDTFRAEVVGVRSVAFADGDHVSSLGLSSRSKTSGGHI